MDKWFSNKFDNGNVRKYTRRNLSKNFFENMLRRFSVTNWLIIINIFIFLFVLIGVSIFGEQQILDFIALQPNSIFQGKVWLLITSMFVHMVFGHLLANLVSLFFIGNFTERIIGRKRLFFIYLISGIFAGLFYAILSYFFGYGFIGERLFTNPMTYAVGASGAIFSLLGILAVITPRGKVFLIAGPIIAIIISTVIEGIYPNSIVIGVVNMIVTLYFIFAIFSMISFNRTLSKIALPFETNFAALPFIAIVPLIIVGLFIPLPIGNMAHLGGLIAGLIYGFYLKTKYKKKTAYVSKIFR